MGRDALLDPSRLSTAAVALIVDTLKLLLWLQAFWIQAVQDYQKAQDNKALARG